MSSAPASPLVATLSVPADVSMGPTMRAFVARFVGAHADDGSLDDLQLALGEACAGMRGPGVTVRLEVDGGLCRVRCDGVEAPDGDDAMRARLFTALAPDAEWFHDETGRGCVRFSLPLRS